jgi:HK97 family phage prohead protease
MTGTRMKRAAFDATVTATEGDEGQFEALVAVFGNVDSQGDIIDPGAFVKTIASWEASGLPIPVIWSHMWEDPFAHLGETVKAEEVAEGLKITGQLDLTNPTAMQVYKLLKARRVVQWSFVASSPDGGYAYETLPDGSTVCHLKELELIEVGPTLRGANTETTVISIKSDMAAMEALVSKEGRVLAQMHVETLKSVHEQLGGIITAVEKTSPPGAAEEKEASASAGAFSISKALLALSKTKGGSE